MLSVNTSYVSRPAASLLLLNPVSHIAFSTAILAALNRGSWESNSDEDRPGVGRKDGHSTA